MVSLTTRHLYSLTFVDTYSAMIVGERGQVVRLNSVDNGNTWVASQFNLGTSSDLRSIQFFDNSNVWISGMNGVVFKSNNGGTTWATIPTGVTQNLNGVSFVSSTQGWCAGSSGTLLVTTNGGNSWQTQPRGNINVGIIDGAKSFVFLGLPLHRLNGDGTVKDFLEHVLFEEFGLR